MKSVDGRDLFLLYVERFFLLDFPDDIDPDNTLTEGLQRAATLRQGILPSSV
jgi:hypothetical protein